MFLRQELRSLVILSNKEAEKPRTGRNPPMSSLIEACEKDISSQENSQYDPIWRRQLVSFAAEDKFGRPQYSLTSFSSSQTFEELLQANSIHSTMCYKEMI